MSIKTEKTEKELKQYIDYLRAELAVTYKALEEINVFKVNISLEIDDQDILIQNDLVKISIYKGK